MLKKATALAALSVSLLLSACSGGKNEQSGQLDKSKTYVVATDAAYAPMEFMENGKVQGFSHDVLDAAAKNQGVKLEFVNTPFDGIFANVNKGDSDIALASITINPERSEQLDFSEPYFVATQTIITQAGEQNIRSFADLKERSASVQAGTSGDLIMQELQGKDSPKIKRFEVMPLAFKELESGGVDALVGDSSVVNYYVQHNPQAKLNLIVDPDFVKENYGFAFRKGRADGLREAINAGLANIKADGTYDKIYQQWFGDSGNPFAASAASASAAQEFLIWRIGR